MEKNTLSLFITKACLLIVVVGGILFTCDRKGYFEANNINNHTERKWNSFYQFGRHHSVDIVMVGNSHLYTGINPKNLSMALGVNAFILASPGTLISDSYYCLEEALTHCKPKIAIIETYGIKEFQMDSLDNGTRSDHIKSFSARRNLMNKLMSTPRLFQTDEWLYAWSTTLRNHRFLFNDREQLRLNFAGKNELRKSQGVYLGRFVTATTGLTQKTLSQYDSKGAVVNGAEYQVGEEASFYVKKIMELCESKNVEVIFLTLPMYHRHIENYPIWHDRLAEVIKPLTSNWLDLQKTYASYGFDEECFEDTYSGNQHMTYKGSLIATYSLAHYIARLFPNSCNLQLRNVNWHRMFYGDEGYFENYSPVKGDKRNVILAANIKDKNFTVDQVTLHKYTDSQLLMAKIKLPDNYVLESQDSICLKLNLKLELNGVRSSQTVVLPFDREHIPLRHSIFSIPLNNKVKIIEIENIALEQKV